MNPIEKQLLVVTGDDAVLTIAPIPNVVNPQPNAPAQHHGAVAADGELLATTGAGPQHFEAQSTRQLIHTVISQNNNLQTIINTLAEERRADRVMLYVPIPNIAYQYATDCKPANPYAPSGCSSAEQHSKQ